MDTQTINFFFTLLMGILIGFLAGYARKKGENLATKADIGAITHEVEKVKALYAEQLQWLQSKQQLRMAALEKRLEAHQQAYALWRKLLSAALSKDARPTVRECDEWWERNCLYLDPDAREAFSLAISAAADHPSYLAGVGGVTGAHVSENYRTIKQAGQAIVKGAQLPALGEREAEDVTDINRRAR